MEFSSVGQPVRHLYSALPLPPGVQREDLDLLRKLNLLHARAHPRESEYEARIENYELAARMQLAAPDVLDLSKESEATGKLYGLDNPVTAGYGRRCLMARRLVEAGVRFVQVFPPLDPNFNPWDSLVLAGGGFKKGFAYGETDEFGYKAVVDRVSVPDLHATILFLLGLDHKRLTYPHHGLLETPTDVRLSRASVVAGVLEAPPQR